MLGSGGGGVGGWENKNVIWSCSFTSHRHTNIIMRIMIIIQRGKASLVLYTRKRGSQKAAGVLATEPGKVLQEKGGK